MKRFALAASSLLALSAAAAAPAHAEQGYYQYPAARGNVLVVASEGDLWRTSRGGGMAIRLTNHEEEERDAVLSPGGALVAFSAAYDSGRDIYVMPVAGGPPKRVTYEGGFVRPVGWLSDNVLLYAQSKAQGRFGEVLYKVDVSGGEPEAIPLWRANDATLADDRQTLFFSRRGLVARANDNAVNYRGGGTAQLWRWTLGSDEEATQLLPDFEPGIRHPMYYDGRIYFVADEGGSDAVWSVKADGTDLRSVTGQMPYPIRQVSLDNGEIFMQNGADIWVYNLERGNLRRLVIDIVSDREQTRVRSIDKPLQNLTSASLAPSGEGVVLTARGRVALGFPKQRRRIEFAIPLDARAREAVLTKDGKSAYMVLDQGMSGDIWRMSADGTGTPERVTRGYDAYIWSFTLSPDGKTAVVHDKLGRLQKVDTKTGAVSLLAKTPTGADFAYSQVRFSPDGKYIAYAEDQDGGAAQRGAIFVQDIATGRRTKATSSKYHDYAPAFSHDGAWLYFISDRNFEPNPGSPWGDRNMGPAFPDRGEIYALQLDPEADFRFMDDNELTGLDEAAEGEGGSGESDSDEDEKEADEKAANVQLAGLASRLYKVPGAKGVGGTLWANQGFLYTGRGRDELVSISISKDSSKTETFARGARAFELSADGKTAFIMAGSPNDPTLALVPAGAKMPDKLDTHRVRLGDWRLQVDPKAEWQQMFLDAWRMHRDFAYDPQLRGVNWDAVRENHEPLVARIGHREELNAILAQMAAPLGILHSQVRAGDVPRDGENADMGFLGAQLSSVRGGGMRIDEIWDSDPDMVDMLPPLRRPGVDVREGDVITHIDGRRVLNQSELALALSSKVGQEVRLDLTRGGAAMSEIVRPMPIFGDFRARFYDRVEDTRAEVTQMSGGNIGYVALNAMGGNDVADFARDFYAQLDKDGLIIDVRGNNGGNVDSIILTALMRRAWAFWSSPIGGKPYTNMQGAYRGHVVVLIDERTYSDGETFAAGFKSLGLGQLIGKRTAGAGIWLSGRNPLTDNGMVRIAEFPQYRLDGEWLIEGWGVSPDIEVENLPHATFNGSDAQLQRAVDVLRTKIAEEPIPELKPRPLPPVGTPGKDAVKLD